MYFLFCLSWYSLYNRVVNKPEGEATPIVIIDNIKDPFATVVSIQFGDYLEELIDTVRH